MSCALHSQLLNVSGLFELEQLKKHFVWQTLYLISENTEVIVKKIPRFHLDLLNFDSQPTEIEFSWHAEVISIG